MYIMLMKNSTTAKISFNDQQAQCGNQEQKSVIDFSSSSTKKINELFNKKKVQQSRVYSNTFDFSFVVECHHH